VRGGLWARLGRSFVFARYANGQMAKLRFFNAPYRVVSNDNVALSLHIKAGFCDAEQAAVTGNKNETAE
jgi:hypothetical protein